MLTKLVRMVAPYPKKLSTESGPSPSCGPGPRAMLGKELYLKRQRREQNDPNTTEFESS